MGRVVLNLRLGLAVAIAMAGCYRPEVGSCFLRCGDNNACPNGLECNTQGVCASTQETLCGELPMIDAEIDSPPSVPTTISIHVVAPDGVGQNDIRIVFSSPTGELIKEVRTPPTGLVVVDDIPTGSAATIYRLVGTSTNATTYLDLWENAQIVSRFSQSTTSRQVMISWTSPSTLAASYDVYSTCFASSVNTNALTSSVTISDDCPAVDVIVIAKDAPGAPIRIASIGNIDKSITNVNIAPAMWGPFDANDSIASMLTNMPDGGVQFRVSGYITPGFWSADAIVEANVPPSGDVGPKFFPTELGASVEIYSTKLVSSTFYQQFYVEKLPANAVTYNRDLATRKFAWLTNDAQLDLTANAIEWSILTPSGTVAQPSIAYAKLSFRRGQDLNTWHIIGPGNRVMSTPTMGTFVLPDIPGMNPFEPIGTDTMIIEEMNYIGTTPGLEDAVRARLESREATLDMFGIPGLTYLMRATAS